MKSLAIGVLIAASLSPAWGESRVPPSPITRAVLSKKALRAYEARSAVIKDRQVRARPFDRFEYDKVIAYDFESKEENGSIIEGKDFADKVFDQRALTQDQTNRILTILGEKTTYGASVAACFEPHLALVFYKRHRIVGHVDICFECNYLQSSMDIPAVTANAVRSGGAVSPGNGFSAAGQKQLKDLCRELTFSHCEPSAE